MSDKRNKRRKENYKKLIAAGFNSAEAKKYKDYSRKRIEALILEREAYNSKITNIINKQEAD